MTIVEIIAIIKKSLEGLEIKATKANCDSLSAAHFWLDKISETCNNVNMQKGGEPVEGESEKQNV